LNQGSSGYFLFARCIPTGECLKCPFRGRSITYGPFRSRRRGTSVGINLFPSVKVCSFNCVYCFRGRTEVKTLEPNEAYSDVDPELLRKALKEAIKNVGHIDAIDFSGNGEPTLHPRFKEFTDLVKRFVKELGIDVSVGIFTNSSTLYRGEVVEALKNLDYVEAKLDTAIQWKFELVNKPCRGLRVDDIVSNLARFRKLFEGVLAVQVMLVRYRRVVNYSLRDAELLADKLSLIEPDVVHVYTTYRTSRLATVFKASEEDMARFAKVLEGREFKVEIFPR